MPNLIDKYRAVHRRLRRLFSTHTAELCPVCPKRCCTKPTLVAEFDVLLANACGYPLPSVNDKARELAQAGMEVLRGEYEEDKYGEPCDFMGENGCVFPDDLRPYECARYICPFLKKALSPAEMREARDLCHRLGVLHRELLDTVTPRKK